MFDNQINQIQSKYPGTQITCNASSDGNGFNFNVDIPDYYPVSDQTAIWKQLTALVPGDKTVFVAIKDHLGTHTSMFMGKADVQSQDPQATPVQQRSASQKISYSCLSMLAIAGITVTTLCFLSGLILSDGN